jgi:hypothetical protein
MVNAATRPTIAVEGHNIEGPNGPTVPQAAGVGREGPFPSTEPPGPTELVGAPIGGLGPERGDRMGCSQRGSPEAPCQRAVQPAPPAGPLRASQAASAPTKASPAPVVSTT